MVSTRSAAVLLLALTAAGCASSGAVPKPFPGAPTPAARTKPRPPSIPEPSPADPNAVAAEPLRVVHWQKAITLWCQGKVEIVAHHDREIRSVSFSMKMPSIIRLLRRIRVRRTSEYVPFSRANIYARDNHKCQYCGHGFPTSELTFDHVVPVAQGGRKDWENIVTCCITCNRRKGGRTPEQAHMRLIRHPRRPDKAPAIRITFGLRNAPESWRDYVYWNVELDEDD